MGLKIFIFFNLNTAHTIATTLTQLITNEQAYHYRIVPVAMTNGIISFKSDQVSEALKQELQILLNLKVNLIEEHTEHIQQYLSVNFRHQGNTKTKDLHYSVDFLEQLLITAKDIGSSDVHFEPYKTNCRVRFRLDGKLKEQFVVSRQEYPIIVNKLKIKAGLDISEKRLPQDGRITVKTNTAEFDIRVSSLPTLHGEKIVLRILNKDSSHLNLNQLGFGTKTMNTYLECLKKPTGIILISGPTGSGKTTTLYATLKLLNNEQTNILTIEDPIEYTLEGINQVQLKENIGLDFPSTLRTFLRQDPDIIMVGEIRDVKTANMAIRAALTGHLVLSTIHTNSAWGTISRLVDMGIPPFLIANTLNMSVAQRLVRKLCNHCKEERPISKDIFPANFKIPPYLKTHYIANGCTNCYHTGYQGRKAIYEIIPVVSSVVEHIKKNDLNTDDYMATHKIESLKNNAVKLLAKGITAVEEVYPLLSK